MNKENSTKNRFGFRAVSRKKVVVKKVRNVLRSSLVFWGRYCCVYLSLYLSRLSTFIVAYIHEIGCYRVECSHIQLISYTYICRLA